MMPDSKLQFARRVSLTAVRQALVYCPITFKISTIR
jgi:hypothetical protein